MGAVEFTIVAWITAIPPHPATAIAFLAAEAIVLFGLAWISGFVGMIGTQFHNRSILNVTLRYRLCCRPTACGSAVYNLEPAAVVAARYWR